MKLYVNVKFICISFLIILIAGCGCQLKERAAMQHSIAKCDPIILPDDGNSMITVFIHGTRIFPKFYAQELFYSPDGLKHISQIEKASHMHTIAHALAKADPARFSVQSFYTFGWNGNLDFNERKKAAHDVYKALKAFSDSYVAKFGKSPRLCIITHSHGGNVALNLAAAVQDAHDKLFHVDELVLLACPVQKETKNYVTDSIFGRVYSLCSCNDVLQVIDPQGLYKDKEQTPVFSERYFEVNPHVLQSKIKHRGRYILHIEFLKKYFYTQLPAIMNSMDTWYGQVEIQSLKSVRIPMIDMAGKKVQIYPKLFHGSARDSKSMK